jgi:hypothetical protein
LKDQAVFHRGFPTFNKSAKTGRWKCCDLLTLIPLQPATFPPVRLVQIGNLKEAMSWLRKAIVLAKKMDMRQMALEDPDLESLWCSVSEI